ncbi:MAG: hypothetical protein LBH82_00945 [Bacteroidales bacterium]|jgi:hypothetical protein|nr:hypothetical protein [Bacteroidales bacterium]
MKKITLTAVLLMFLLSGCRYEEGPFINFRKVEKRIKGLWNISSVEKNGEILSNNFPTYIESVNTLLMFTSGGIITITYYKDNINVESSGHWEFQDRKKILHVTFQNMYRRVVRDYEIIKFRNNILKVKFTEDGNEYIITFSLINSLANL